MDWCMNQQGSGSGTDPGLSTPYTSYKSIKSNKKKSSMFQSFHPSESETPIFAPRQYDCNQMLHKVRQPTSTPNSKVSNKLTSDYMGYSPPMFHSPPAKIVGSSKLQELQPIHATDYSPIHASPYSKRSTTSFAKIPSPPKLTPTTFGSSSKSLRKQFKNLNIEEDSDLLQDDTAFTAIAKYILDTKNETLANNGTNFSSPFQILDKKIQKSFIEALQYRISLLPIFPEAGEGALPKLTREAAKKCGNMVIIGPSDESKNFITPLPQPKINQSINKLYPSKSPKTKPYTSKSPFDDDARKQRKSKPASILKSPRQKSRNDKSVIFEKKKKVKSSKDRSVKDDRDQKESPRGNMKHGGRKHGKRNGIQDGQINVPEDSSDEPSLLEIERRKLQMAKKRSVLMLNEARAVGEQSKIREQLINEMKTASEALKKSKNSEMNAAYEQHLNDLHAELTKWCGYDSDPKKTKSSQRNGDEIARAETFENVTKNKSPEAEHRFWLQLEQTKMDEPNKGENDILSKSPLRNAESREKIEVMSTQNQVEEVVGIKENISPPVKSAKTKESEETLLDKNKILTTQEKDSDSNKIECAEETKVATVHKQDDLVSDENENNNKIEEHDKEKKSKVPHVDIQDETSHTPALSPTDGEIPSIVPIPFAENSLNSTLATTSEESFPYHNENWQRTNKENPRNAGQLYSNRYDRKNSNTDNLMQNNYQRNEKLYASPKFYSKHNQNVRFSNDHGRFDQSLNSMGDSVKFYDHGSKKVHKEASSRLVRVVAPANLCENSKFEVKVGNKKFMAVVPEGGVKCGQPFLSPMISKGKEFGLSFSSDESPIHQSFFQKNSEKKQDSSLRVVAVEDLHEGKTIEAEFNGSNFLVAVPKGGVKKGEIFSSRIIEEKMNSPSDTQSLRQHVGIALINNEIGSENDSQSTKKSKKLKIQVVAPNDLQEGYKFAVELKGERYLVMVPKGGVKKGEIFSSDVIDDRKNDADEKLTRQHVGMAMIQENDGYRYGVDRNISIDKKCERIQVVAPNDLSEGKKIEVKLKDNIYLVTVPKGGVKRGELFFADIHDVIRDGKDDILTRQHIGMALIKQNDYDAKRSVSTERDYEKIQVVAPDDLSERKKIEIDLKDKSYLVTVPKAGVEKGEVFCSDGTEKTDQDEMSGINSTNEKQKYLAVAKQKQSKKSQRDDALESKRCKNQLTVKVVAPETLPEGFKFEAELNEETFQVKVPKGGVRKGQVFSSLIFHGDECSKKSNLSRKTKSTQATAVALIKRDSEEETNSDKSDVKNNLLPMVSVVAPDDLPEGYRFEAELNGQNFQVTVPVGGVRKGDIFKSVPIAKDVCSVSLQRSKVTQSVSRKELQKEDKECVQISVIAPSNLPEGYIFDVELNGNSASVVVPKGGVKQGEIFSSPILDKKQMNSNEENTLGSSQHSIPLTLDNSSISSKSNVKDSVITKKVDLQTVSEKVETLNELRNSSTLSQVSHDLIRSKSSPRSSLDKKKIVEKPLTNSSQHALKNNFRHPKTKIPSFDSSHEDGVSTKNADDSTSGKTFPGKTKWNENMPNEVVTIQDSFSRKNNKNILNKKTPGDRERQSPLLKKDEFKVNIPVGFWKDQLFCCLADGVTHNVVFSSIFCPHIALAQIRNRMNMIEKGKGQRIRQSTNIKLLFTITLFYIFLHGITIYYVLREGTDVAILYLICVPLFSFDVLGILIFFVMVVQTRQNIRSTFEIPHHECQCCADTVLAVGCTCCTLTQMARHTGDYLTYRGYCCTDTGLPDHIDLSFA